VEKETKKYRRYGKAVYYMLTLLSKTYKIEIINEERLKTDGGVIGFWHDKLVSAATALNVLEKRIALASASKDGELISVPLELSGYGVVRGSSGRDGAKALLKLVKKAKEGWFIGTPLDGPKGPVYKAKPGMLYVAQKANKDLILVGVAYSKKWTFNKAWDKFQLPKPFSKMVCVVGEPIKIEKKADLEVLAKEIEEKLNSLNNEAEKLIKGWYRCLRIFM